MCPDEAWPVRFPHHDRPRDESPPQSWLRLKLSLLGAAEPRCAIHLPRKTAEQFRGSRLHATLVNISRPPGLENETGRTRRCDPPNSRRLNTTAALVFLNMST